MSDDDLNVVITWRPAEDDGWDARRCVFAYADIDELPGPSSIAYVGKADSQSVREVWDGHQADGLLDQLDIDPLVLVGTVEVVDGNPLTEKLLGEIEGLLIHFLDPLGNRKRPTILRSGLVITNKGRPWYGEETMATDDLDDADVQDESLDDEDDEDPEDD